MPCPNRSEKLLRMFFGSGWKTPCPRGRGGCSSGDSRNYNREDRRKPLVYRGRGGQGHKAHSDEEEKKAGVAGVGGAAESSSGSESESHSSERPGLGNKTGDSGSSASAGKEEEEGDEDGDGDLFPWWADPAFGGGERLPFKGPAPPLGEHEHSEKRKIFEKIFKKESESSALFGGAGMKRKT